MVYLISLADLFVTTYGSLYTSVAVLMHGPVYCGKYIFKISFAIQFLDHYHSTFESKSRNSSFIAQICADVRTL